jgi:hypothetical protein
MQEVRYGMRSAPIDKTRNDIDDRRRNNARPHRGTPERRIHSERRGIVVGTLSFDEWSEAARNYYYHHATPYCPNRRWSDRRIACCGPAPGNAERRSHAERRLPRIQTIEAAEWTEAMANYYYHFHR